MLVPLVLLLIAAAAVAIWFVRSSPARRVRRLEEAYFRRAQLPRKLAAEALERHLEGLEDRHPGRSYDWYLRRILTDLQRDRRAS